MCEFEILTVFHFGGEFDWDNGNPVYIGGDKKMLYLRSNLTFHELFEKNIRSDEMGATRRQHNHKMPTSKWACEDFGSSKK